MSALATTRLLPFFETRLPAGLDLLEQWVGQNSFTAHAAGVNALGQATADAFASLGFAPEYVASDSPEYGRHLFLRRGRNGRPPIVLVTHLDTVFPPEEERAHGFQWRPEPSEGRIYGPGTVDIKGGTLVLWLAVQALAELTPDVFDAHDWLIAANASEEALSPDFGVRTMERCPGKLAGGPPTATAVLVFEGGMLRGREFTLVTGRKGKADFRVSASGRAAHAGSQHREGRNAIVALSEAVGRLAALTDHNREVTVNVGSIRGGTVVNRVPHEAACELEMRAFDDAIFAATQAQIQALAGPSAAVPGVMLDVTQIGQSPAWPGDAGTRRLLALFQETAASQCAAVVPERRGGLSDANYLAGLGPTIDGLGPSGGCAHCSERSADGSKTPEYVETASFIPKAALVFEALRRLE